MITQNFDLNMVPDSPPVVVHVDQYDHGASRLIATLYDGDVVYTPAPGATVEIQGTKPDGKGFEYSARLSGSTVIADLTEQMTAVAGSVRTQIVVTESSRRTGTFVFILDVQKSALPADADMSESEYQKIEGLLEAAEGAIQAADDAADSAEDSEAYAKGTRNGTAVTSSDPAYHNNSLYYADVSSQNGEAWSVGTRNGTSVPPTDPAYNNYAKYWAGRAEHYAQGALIFEGTIYFAELPTTGMKVGAMYNIKDEFTTDSRFEEGAGIKCDAGTNVAWTPNNTWDILAGNVKQFVTISQAQFNQLTTEQKNDPNIYWWIYDASGVAISGGGGSGVTAYPDLTNKPQINGNTLVGNMTAEQLGLNIITAYPDLTNKPQINGNTLVGNMTLDIITAYPDLTNKPQINGNTLVGNMTADQLGLLGALTFSTTASDIIVKTVFLPSPYSFTQGETFTAETDVGGQQEFKAVMLSGFDVNHEEFSVRACKVTKVNDTTYRIKASVVVDKDVTLNQSVSVSVYVTFIR